MANLPMLDDDALMQLQSYGKLTPGTVDAVKQSRARLGITPDEAAAIDSSPIPTAQQDAEPPVGTMAHAQWLDRKNGFVAPPPAPPKPGSFAYAQQVDKGLVPSAFESRGPAAEAASSQPLRVDTSMLATNQPQQPASNLPPMPNVQDYLKPFGQIASGILGEAKAQQQGYEGQTKIYDDLQRQQQELQTQVQKNQDERKAFSENTMKALDAKQADLEKEHAINPNRYWQDMSTGRKVASVIGIMLGGFGGALTGNGKNPALDMLNKSIDQDIMAQKENYEQKKEGLQNQRTAYSMAMQEFGNRETALLAAKASALQIAELQVKQQMAKTESQAVKARGEVALGQLGQQKNELGLKINSQLYQMQALRQATGGGGVENPAFLPEDMQKKAVKMPNGMFRVASSEEGRKAIETKSVAVNDIKNTLASMKKIQGAAIPHSQRAELAEQLKSKLIFQMKNFEGLGALPTQDLALFEKSLIDPTSVRQDLVDAKMSTLLGSLNHEMENTYKQYLPGYRPLQTGEAKDVRK